MIQIVDKHDCCGCTACASICGHKALTMVADEEGFVYPECDESACTDCGLCEKVCPVITRDASKIDNEIPIRVLALHNKDEQTWTSSSSGGVFSALAELTVNRGGIVYGAEYDDRFVVVHRGETSADGILKFRGSKYVQSDLTGIYREIRAHLRDGKEVLFSGVPCQVEGLKNFLLKPYDNLTTVDILCHGVPSPKVFADYISYIQRHTILPLRKVFMKDKTFGWGYQNLRLTYCGKTSEFNTPVSNLWNKIFYDHVANRPSCHKCRFKNLNRAGDLSIGDFWGIDRHHPEFASQNGISLLLINSLKGEKVWNDVRTNFNHIESDIEECLQPVLQHSSPEPSDRVPFWKEYLERGFDYTVRKRYNISLRDLFRRNISLILHKLF